MVSRRNYITITIMILILLFMFQFIGVMKDALNEYGTNEYEKTAVTELDMDDMYKLYIPCQKPVFLCPSCHLIYTYRPYPAL